MTLQWMVRPTGIIAQALTNFEDMAGAPDSQSIQFAIPWGWWWTALLLIVALVAIRFIYRRETRNQSPPVRGTLLLLRSLLVLLVVWMALGPTRYPDRTELPALLVLLDNSASMSIVDQQPPPTNSQDRLQATGLTEPSRINQAKALLLDSQTQDRLGDRYRLAVYPLSSEAALPRTEDGPIDPQALQQVQADHPDSRLGEEIIKKVQTMGSDRPAAVVLISDGVVTDGITLAATARRMHAAAIPVFTVGVGQAQAGSDIRIQNVAYQQDALVNDVIGFDFQINSYGYDGRRVQAQLRTKNGRLLAQREVVLSQRDPPRLTLVHQPDRAATWNYEVRVDVVEGEADSDNNSVACNVNVRDETIDVLLVQSYPSYEFRYLQQLLARPRDDATGSIALTTVLQSADPDLVASQAEMRSSVPHDMAELLAYDVIILGDVNPDWLSPTLEEHLVALVNQHGRSIIFMAGPDFLPDAYRGRPLAALFPFPLSQTPTQVIDQSFRAQLTRLGDQQPHLRLSTDAENNAEIWQQLGPMFWRRNVPALNPGVQVLVAADVGSSSAAPLICQQYVGAGRVRFQLTDETHRWRMRVGDTYFARYWLQSLRYLSNRRVTPQPLRLSTDRKEYPLGSPVRLRAQFSQPRAVDEPVEVAVQSDAVLQRVAMIAEDDARLTFYGGLTQLPTGNYRAQLNMLGLTSECEFDVRPANHEMAALQANFDSLARLAKVTNGRHYTMQSADRMPMQLPRGERRVVEQRMAVPVWNNWQTAALLIGLLAAEWVLRKRVGLI